MVKQLLEDVDKKYSVPADIAVQNISRWVSDESMPFHDPLLKKAVQKVYKRCFMEFIHKLQQLGIKVIQAGLYKIIYTS